VFPEIRHVLVSSVWWVLRGLAFLFCLFVLFSIAFGGGQLDWVTGLWSASALLASALLIGLPWLQPRGEPATPFHVAAAVSLGLLLLKMWGEPYAAESTFIWLVQIGMLIGMCVEATIRAKRPAAHA